MPIILTIKVIPASGRQEWRYKDGQLKCYLKNPPEKGKANTELLGLLSKSLGISIGSIRIMSGINTRTKRVAIDDEGDLDSILKRLKIDVQLKI